MRSLILPGQRSIRGRLLLFLISSVVLTALAISLVTISLGFRGARERVVDQLRSVLTLKQQEVASWASGLQLNLDIVLSSSDIARDLRLTELAPPESRYNSAAYGRLQRQFTWAAERMDLFEEVFFMDTEGTVLISTVRGHENQKLGLRSFFAEGLKGSHIEEPSYSLSLDKMTVVASTPVEDAGEVIGVLAGQADLAGLNQIMIKQTGLGETGETYLVGSNHRLLTHLRLPGYSIPNTYIRTEGSDAAIDQQLAGSTTYEGYAGEDVIGVFTWIPELKVALLAEQEEAEALRPTRLILMIMGGVAVVAVALAVLAGIALTRSIVRPLAELDTTADRIAEGDLDLRARVEREDEIGRLAHSFNRMTTQLGQLVESLRRRTDHLRAINETGRQISSILDLDELLPYVARSLMQSFAYQTVRILLLAGEGEAILLTYEEGLADQQPTKTIFDHDAARALPAMALAARESAAVLMRPGSDPVPFVARPAAETTTVSDVESEMPTASEPGATGNMVDVTSAPSTYAELAVTIRVGDDLVGVLDIVGRENDNLDAQDLFAAQTLADQLAIAIENSRLYVQARELAAGQERQRLARDLHDAVSQTLFSVSLIAEVLPRIYERDPEQGRERLEELRQLTRGALAEMRTLLLELRPAALAEADLPDLLRQLAEAVMGRSRIPVQLNVEPDVCVDLPVEVRIAYYRIAQEALNNIAKHSGATRATVGLTCEDVLQLRIEDDGTGFDPASPSSGRLGLGIMEERAQSIGARLKVEAKPGVGTAISVSWKPPGRGAAAPRGEGMPSATGTGSGDPSTS